MKVSKSKIGKTVGHEFQDPQDVYDYHIDNGENLQITVRTYGATLFEVLWRDKSGRTYNVIQNFESLKEYEDIENNCYMGSTLGRFARCIAESEFQLGGEKIKLKPNYKDHHFHGGPIGFDKFNWDAHTEISSDCLSVILTLSRPDGDQGYPGDIYVEVRYELYTNDILKIKYKATCTKTTLVALTNHIFWNLSGNGNIDNHILCINSKQYIPTDLDFIPSAEPQTLIGTERDYNSARQIGSNSLDQCYVIENNKEWLAKLYERTAEKEIVIYSDQPVLAVYTGDFLNRKRSGITFQTGAFPNAPNYTEAFNSILNPGQTYKHFIEVRFNNNSHI